MSPELQKKVDRAVRFLKSIPDEDPVEVAYSGGKDSDVICSATPSSTSRSDSGRHYLPPPINCKEFLSNYFKVEL